MSKKVTTESYINELKIINPNVKVNGEYIRARAPIEHECLVCGFIWNVSPNNIKNGHGCPECSKKHLGDLKRYTTDQFLEKYKDTISPFVKIIGEYTGNKNKIECLCLMCNKPFMGYPLVIAKGGRHKTCVAKEQGEKYSKSPEAIAQEMALLHPDVELLSDYRRATEKFHCRCKVCDHEWDTTAGNLRKSEGCPKCSQKRKSQKRMYSNEEYVKMLQQKNPTVISLENYRGIDTKILHKCLLHNVEWYITPNNALHGQGCKQCLKERISKALISMTDEQYKRKVEIINPNVVPMEEFQGVDKKILHKYIKCGHEAYTLPSLILNGAGCNICAKKMVGFYLKKTNAQYCNELQAINPDIVPLEDYVTSNTKIKHKCLLDRHEWDVSPSSLLQGHGCPICNASIGEKKIRAFLATYNIEYEAQKTFEGLIGVNNGLLSYDFYLPKYNLLIEYQGEQHEHSVKGFTTEADFERQKEHDKRKKKYAENHEYNYLIIWYWEFDKIEVLLYNLLISLKSLSVETTGHIE